MLRNSSRFLMEFPESRTGPDGETSETLPKDVQKILLECMEPLLMCQDFLATRNETDGKILAGKLSQSPMQRKQFPRYIRLVLQITLLGFLQALSVFHELLCERVLRVMDNSWCRQKLQY